MAKYPRNLELIQGMLDSGERMTIESIGRQLKLSQGEKSFAICILAWARNIYPIEDTEFHGDKETTRVMLATGLKITYKIRNQVRRISRKRREEIIDTLARTSHYHGELEAIKAILSEVFPS